MRRALTALATAMLLIAEGAPAAGPTLPQAKGDLDYPSARRDAVVEDRFGEAIPDPYRWLEAEPSNDPAVAGWIDRENALTRRYLDALPMRAWFARRIRELTNYERIGLPEKAGRSYFYARNSGLMNQSQLYVREGLNGAPRLLLDPNTWSSDGSAALDAWKPSNDGRYLLYAVQERGSDWRVLHVLDVESGRRLVDEVRWVKFSSLAWVGREGFLYSRFPEPPKGSGTAPSLGQQVYFHRLGTPQAADTLVHATPDHPGYGHTAQVTQDGRLAVIVSSPASGERHEIRVADLAVPPRRRWRLKTIVEGFASDWRLVGGSGNRLWFVTNWKAPRYRLVAIDLARSFGGTGGRWREVVRERDDTLDSAVFVGNELVLNYQRDGAVRAQIVSLQDGSVREMTLGGIGTASGFRGRPGDPETFFTYASFNQPALVYRMDIASGQAKPFAQPEPGFDPGAYVVEQRYYTSKDGTRIPMYLVRSRAVVEAKRAVPTLLYGYGGFDVSLNPTYSAIRTAWLEAGGAFALANLRGGGERGREWHEAGRRANKQNTFDDFIAAGEFLLAQGITPKDGLAIQGASNGGLLVAAVVNQRPDLFAAANPQVGVMDMLRFDRFTAGHYWAGDYGDPSREADFRVLRAYSPYHNIRQGQRYPAMLVTTAAGDDRVVPAHSYKYAAALQAAAIGDRPRLLRVESRAGHGTGKPVAATIEEGADILAFLAHWSGLDRAESADAGVDQNTRND